MFCSTLCFFIVPIVVKKIYIYILAVMIYFALYSNNSCCSYSLQMDVYEQLGSNNCPLVGKEGQYLPALDGRNGV
jgi:hypothetical protein